MEITIDEAIKNAKEKAKKNREAEALFLRDNCIWNAKQENKLAEKQEQLVEWLEKLKKYEQAEKDGLLFRLACNVGSTVYIISRKKIIPLKICGIYINKNSVAMYGMNEQYYGYGKVTLFGNKKHIEWFETEEEAKNVLANEVF